MEKLNSNKSDTIVELRKTRHCFIEPGIIKLEVNAGEFIDVDDVVKMHEANLWLSKGGPFSVLLDTSMGYFNTTADARKLIASKEYALVMKASAFVVQNLATRLAGNFFINLNKPHAPTRLFNSETEALAWLRQFVK